MSTPPEYAAFLDDAAAPALDGPALEAAVASHLALLGSTHAPLIGSLVVTDTVLPALLRLLQATPGDRPALAVVVVVSGGAGGIEPASRWAADPALDLRGVEVALRDPDDLVGNARRVVTAADRAGLGAPVYVAPPTPEEQPSRDWLGALDEVAAADLRLSLHAAGSRVDRPPPPPPWPASSTPRSTVSSAFRVAAGADRAVREQGSAGRPAGHGFLNLLLATRATLDGTDVAAVLEEARPVQILGQLTAVGPETLQRTRRWCLSVGVRSVPEALVGLPGTGSVGTDEDAR